MEDREAEDTPHSEELDNETQMEPNTGLTPPILAQSLSRSRSSVSPERTRVRAKQQCFLNALHVSRENRGRSSTSSPTRSRSGSSGENPGTPGDQDRGPPADPSSTPRQRGRKRWSMIWNHMRQKKVRKGNRTVVLTCCNYCPSNWALSSSTSTALHHLKREHSDKI